MNEHRVPLYHHSTYVGDAIVDESLHELSKLNWFLEFPRTLHNRISNRPDVAIAMLREDPTTLSRCHPVIRLRSRKTNLVLRMSHAVLCPLVIPLLLSCKLETLDPFELDTYITAIRNHVSKLNRVVVLNQNRVDLRGENLRGIFNETPQELVSHED